MQLEDLQDRWQRIDEQLARVVALEAENLRHAVLRPARRRLNWGAIWPALDIGFGIAVAILAGGFLAEHARDSRLLIPAVTVIAGAVALVISCVRQLDRLARVEWSGSVAAIQTELDRLRVLKLRQFKWVILLAPLWGFCGLLIGLEALFLWTSHGQFRLIDRIDTAYVAANYAFGLVFIPLGYCIARILGRRCKSQSWWRGILDGVSGSGLREAMADVTRWQTLTADSRGDNP